MNIIESIKTCFKKCFDFSGRASRSEYWYFVLFCTLSSYMLMFIDMKVQGMFGMHMGFLNILFSIVICIPSLAVVFRRLHDVNRSAWWLLLYFTVIGVFVLIYWACKKGGDGENRFGNNPLKN